MRSIVWSLLVSFALFFLVAVDVIVQHAVRGNSQTAIGLTAVLAIAISPVFWVIYAAGFAVTFWLTRAS